MLLTLFHQQSRRVVHGDRAQMSPFGHTFGGSVDYRGLVAYPKQPPVHLLFRLATADPLVGVEMPGVEWLPLLCAIRYGACNLGYRVLSDDEVTILHQTEAKGWRGFPYAGYSKKLPAQPVALQPGTYDPAKIEDALSYAGVFGYEALSAAQLGALQRYVETDLLPDQIYSYETAEEYLEDGNGLPFVQGRPNDDCPDPACGNHGIASSLRTFAIFEEEETERVRELWGPNCGGLQIIYQVCPLCSAIRTSNQCT